MAPAKVVGVDVVGGAVVGGRERRQHRNEIAAEDLVEHHGVDRLRLADEAEVDHLLDIGAGIGDACG